MKNRNSIYIIVIIALVVLVGLFLFNPFKKDSKQPTRDRDRVSQNTGSVEDKIENANEDGSEILSGSVLDLLKLGKTLKCTYTAGEEGSVTTGTSYISGKRMRGDFDITSENDSKIVSHMVSDGEWMYSWSDNMDKGMKMKYEEVVAEDTDATDTTTDETNENLDALKNQVDYKCSNWIVDTSLFEVPSDIEFVDYSQMLKDITGGDGSMCAACAYAPNEEDKAACLARLNCN